MTRRKERRVPAPRASATAYRPDPPTARQRLQLIAAATVLALWLFCLIVLSVVG
ncbi:hypothetical protein JCM19992_34370 [Thermostilla marina]